MDTTVVAIILVVLLSVGVKASVRHMRGEGGCCGGGSTIRENKKLDGEKLGEKVITVEGMHCENCQNRIERKLNKLDGVACRVHLKKKQAVVSYSREVSDEELTRILEELDFSVIKIETK